MERLTHRYNNGTAYTNVDGYIDLLNKLADYEDAEEQGLLLRLPCPIGTTVYVHTPFCKICISDYPCGPCTKSSFVEKTKFDYKMIPLVGECVFLTREEAEKALADMGV